MTWYLGGGYVFPDAIDLSVVTKSYPNLILLTVYNLPATFVVGGYVKDARYKTFLLVAIILCFNYGPLTRDPKADDCVSGTRDRHRHPHRGHLRHRRW